MYFIKDTYFSLYVLLLLFNDDIFDRNCLFACYHTGHYWAAGSFPDHQEMGISFTERDSPRSARGKYLVVCEMSAFVIILLLELLSKAQQQGSPYIQDSLTWPGRHRNAFASHQSECHTVVIQRLICTELLFSSFPCAIIVQLCYRILRGVFLFPHGNKLHSNFINLYIMKRKRTQQIYENNTFIFS